MLSFNNYYRIIVEGGNVFTVNPTVRIQLANIKPTVDMLSNIIGINLNENLLGSTGKRESSGDLDIAINNTKFTKDELTSLLLADLYATYPEVDEKGKFKVNPKEYIAKSGISVHFKTRIVGLDNEFVQTDFMFVPDVKFAQFGLANDEMAPFSGKHRQVLLANLAKNINLMWSGIKGITNRDTGAIIEGSNPNRVAQILLGDENAKSANLKTIPNIISFLHKKYKDVELVLNILSNARHIILKDGLDIATLLPHQKLTESTSHIKPSGKRSGIQHLYSEYNPTANSIGFENFQEFVNVLDDNKGIIQPGNSTATEKIDGMSCKFGITADNKFFLQPFNSNTIITDGDFKSKEAKSVGSRIVREAFEKNFNEIKKVVYKTLLQYKRQLKIESGIKVQAEWLYSPFAIPREDTPGLVYCIATNSETDKMGKWSTFALINITDLQHNELSEDIKNDISVSLVNLTTKDIKILPFNIEMFRSIDLTEELQKAKQELSTFRFHYPNYQTVLYNPSKKQIDTKPKKELREHLQRVLLPIQKRMHEKIIKSIDILNSRLGEFEGILIQLNSASGVPLILKVVSPTLRKNKDRV